MHRQELQILFSARRLKMLIDVKMYRQELQFLFSAHRLMMLYISIKFYENILNGFAVIERTRNYHCRISKGSNSKTIQTRIMVLVFWKLSDDAQYFYKVSWKYLEWFLRYEADTNLPKFQRGMNNSKTLCPRIMVLVFCTLPDDALYLLEVSLKYLERYRADTIAWRTDRQTDRHPMQKQYVPLPSPSGET